MTLWLLLIWGCKLDKPELSLASEHTADTAIVWLEAKEAAAQTDAVVASETGSPGVLAPVTTPDPLAAKVSQ